MGSPAFITALLEAHIPPTVPATAAGHIAAAAQTSDQIVVFVLAAAAPCGGLGEISPTKARRIAETIRFGEME